VEIFEQIWSAIRTGTLPDLGAWSYLLLFILVFLEGPAVTMMAGAMAGAGILRFDMVLLVAICANTIADYTWYLLGYFGGSRSILYRTRWMRRRRHVVQRLRASVRQEAVRLFILTKLAVGVMSIPVLIAAGMSRVAWWRLFFVSLVVEPIWNGILIFAGYRLGDYISQLDRGLRIVALLGSAVIVWLFIDMYRRVLRRISWLDVRYPRSEE
jgi:membrane protein DedA with SNARE-associated domain